MTLRAWNTEDEWLAWRAGRITATAVAAILGHSPWEGPLTAWARITGRHTPNPPGLAATVGTAAQDAIAEWWAAEHHHAITTPALWCGFDHPDHPWLAASIDHTLDNDDLLEIKLTSQRWDTLPDHIDTQARTELAVAHANGWGTGRIHVVAVTVPGWRPRTWTITHQPDQWAATLAQLADWWDTHVKAGRPPRATAADLRLVTVDADPDAHPVWLDPDTTGLVHQLAAARLEARQANSRVEDLEAAVKQALGPATDAWLDGDPDDRPPAVTWRAHQRRSIDPALLAGLHGPATRIDTRQASWLDGPLHHQLATRTTTSRALRLRKDLTQETDQ